MPLILVRFQSKKKFIDKFWKNAQISNFMKICSVVAGQRQMDRRTEDRHDETNNRFSQFCEGA